eukprot:1016268-Pleurochrysis_carterae.AAC.2
MGAAEIRDTTRKSADKDALYPAVCCCWDLGILVTSYYRRYIWETPARCYATVVALYAARRGSAVHASRLRIKDRKTYKTGCGG